MRRSAFLVFLLLWGGASLLGQAPASGQVPHAPGEPMIEGRVLLPNGKPAPSVHLLLEPENSGGMPESATTDSGGYFSFAGKFVSGTWVILVDAPGFQTIRRPVVVPSHTIEADFALQRLPSAAGSHRGAVVSVESLEVPRKARTQYERGVHFMEEGKYAQAAGSFRKAIHIYPNYAAGFRHLAAVYANQGRFPMADQAIQHALRTGKCGAENLAYQGYVYVKEKQLDKAGHAFEKSIAISKDNWVAQLGLGGLLYKQRNYQDAYSHLVIAHRLHPQVRSVHLLLYNDLILLGKRKEALAELDDILARFPNDPEAAKLRKIRPALASSLSKEKR